MSVQLKRDTCKKLWLLIDGKGSSFEICTFSKSLIDLLSMPVTTSTC